MVDSVTTQQPVLVIMGVSGSGKSTVARTLAGRLGWDLEEGDDLHPVRNVMKMAAGDPLTDEDRWPWLDRVAEWIYTRTAAGVPGVITCSALKRVYRDKLRGDRVVIVHLTRSRDTIGHRLAARTDHFMPTGLLDSQITTLEPPGDDENVLVVDVGRRSADEADEIITRLRLRVESHSPASTDTARQTAKALVVHGAGDLRLGDMAVEPPGPEQAWCASPTAGSAGRICTTHYYRHGAVGAFALREPLVLGHEVVGRVEQDPAGTLAPGTSVAIHPASPCGHCPECAAGARNVCRNARYLGSAANLPHTQGGFAEHVVVHRQQVRVVPPNLPLSRAVLAEPLAVGIHALRRAGGVAGARVLLSGAGPIGILAAGAAVAAGAAEVWATDLLDHPLEIAAKVGTHRTARVDTDPLPDQYFDVVVEASGAVAAVGPALSAVRRRGVVVQLGMFPPGPKPVELSALIAKEVDYRGTFRFDTEFDDALALLATTTMFDPVVTHTFALAQAREAMHAAADATTSGKVVLNLSDD